MNENKVAGFFIFLNFTGNYALFLRNNSHLGSRYLGKKMSSKNGVEREGFEPSKANAGRFTVCSLWPLGHLSKKFAVANF